MMNCMNKDGGGVSTKKGVAMTAYSLNQENKKCRHSNVYIW